MPCCAKMKHRLALLACLLTVVASGDDFCFMRLAVSPPTPDVLPLDDPNCDFVESAGPWTAHQVRRSACEDRGMAPGPCALLMPTNPCLPVTARAGDPHSRFSQLTPPLRC
jgi:hypothetical protein